MGKALAESDLAPIEAMLRDQPDGLSIKALAGSEATEAERRVIQRRLNKLIALGRVKTTGASRSTRYFLKAQTSAATMLHKDEAHLDEEGGFFVPVSKAGQSIQDVLKRPREERAPVGYNREFLSSYRPNSTFLLTQREREYLAKVGAVDSGPAHPAGTHARHILDRLLIDLSWNSSRLEGNTYSILDTQVLLDHGKTAEGKSAEETQMLLNHKEAIEFLVESANEIGFNRHTILNLHSILAQNLMDAQVTGRLRQRIVDIGGSSYVPLQTTAVIEECFHELLTKAAAIIDPFEQSLFVVIQIPYLQPFQDVNKRVSRLSCNIPFIKGNLSPVSFIDVPEAMYVQSMLAVYELNKTELARDMFIWAYERSARRYAAIRQSIGEPDPFRLRYREQIREAVSKVVRNRLNKTNASDSIRQFMIDAVPEDDRKKFVEATETELMGLHEGNFARFRIRPTEFYAWKAGWESN